MSVKIEKIDDFAILKYNKDTQILYVEYPALVKVTFDKAHKIINKGFAMVEDEKFYLITDIRNVTGFSFDSLKIFLNFKADKIFANAVITDNSRTEKFFSTLTKIHHPKIPMKFFFSYTEAENWIYEKVHNIQTV
jgi:hypothetical protein